MNWHKIKCGTCDGHGMVSKYTYDGSDFEGPEECGDCWGQGSIWISPKGRLALYPGGPFLGSVQKKAAEI